MVKATMTSKGQVTIPKRVRDDLGLVTGDHVGFVADGRGIYRLPRGGLAQAVETLWNDPAFSLEHRGLVRAALDLFRRGRADFNDYLIGQIAKQAGGTTTYTFDRGLRGARGFTWLRAG